MGDRVRDWGGDALDLPAYLDRVGVPARAPSAAALAELTAAHITAIPFEDVDVVLGAHPGISLDVVAAKLVDRRRGGAQLSLGARGRSGQRLPCCCPVAEPQVREHEAEVDCRCQRVAHAEPGLERGDRVGPAPPRWRTAR